MDGGRGWQTAMHEALYGEHGFYRGTSVPARHFRTAAHVSPQWADAVAELCRRVDTGLGEPAEFTVVDLGAGGGELLAALAGTTPARWRLLGVDVAARPPALPTRVAWSAALPDSFDGVLLAVEWLDVVPVDVVERADDGLRVVLVSTDGEEQLGHPPDDADRRWLDRWWPPVEVGDRSEVGRPRDDAWVTAVSRLRQGLAVAVDYGVVPARDVAGTMSGYRDGRQVPPVPDGTMDLTAHVLMESCAAAVADSVDETQLLDQRAALRDLGLAATRPAYGGDARAYLEALSAVGDAAELLDAGGLGSFTWLLAARGLPMPVGGPGRWT